MKYLLLIIGLVCCFTLQAQKNKPAKRGHLFIGFNSSPDYNYRVLKRNGGSSNTSSVLPVRNEREVRSAGFTTGLNFCVNFSHRVGFDAGVQYSNKGYQTTRYLLFYSLPPRSIDPIAAKFIYDYDYIDIPLKINLTFGKNKIRFISSAGFAANILVNSNVKSVLEYTGTGIIRQNETSTDDFKKVNISPLISLGVECKIRNKMYVRAEPTFRYQLLKNIDQPITEHLWNAGINVSFYYQLR